MPQRQVELPDYGMDAFDDANETIDVGPPIRRGESGFLPQRGYDSPAENGNEFESLANPGRIRSRDYTGGGGGGFDDDVGGDDANLRNFDEPRNDDLGFGEDVAQSAAKIRSEKTELLRKLNDFAARGISIPADLSMQSHIDDLRYHAETIERSVSLKASIRMQKR